jgi:hypothetical protein
MRNIDEEIKKKRKEKADAVASYNSMNSDRGAAEIDRLYGELSKLLVEKAESTITIGKEVRPVTINKTYVKFDGYETEAFDLIELLNELNTCDGFFEHILINDSKLERKLVEMEVVCKSARGGCSKGPIFEVFRNRIFEAVYGENWRDEIE